MADNLQLDDLKIKITVDPKQAQSGIRLIANALSTMASGASKTSEALRNITAGLEDMGEKCTESGEATEKSSEKQASAFKRVAAFAKNAAKGGISLFGKTIKGTFGLVGKAVGGVVGKFATLWGAIKRIAFYRMIRTAIKEVTQALREGLSLLVEWDRTYGNNTSRAAQTTDELAAKWREVKKSLGAAAMPLIQLFQPALERIMQTVINIANLINQTVRAFQGFSTYIKATNKGFKSAVGSAKELKRILFGFDELNVLPSETGGGAGAEVGAIDFEEVDIEKTFNFGAIERFKQFIDEIKTKWGEFKDNISSGGSIIGSVFNFIGGIVQSLGTLVADVFRGIGSVINNWVKNLGLEGTAAGEILGAIGDAFVHVGDIIEGIVTLNFPMIITGLQGLFNDALHLVDGGLWEIENLINAALTWLEEKLGLDFDSIRLLVGGLFTAIRTIIGIGLPAILGTIFGWIGDVINLFKGLFSGLVDIWDGIIQFIDGVFSGNFERAWDGVVNIFKGVANIFISIAEFIVNAILTPVQAVARAINNFKISIPDWIPLVGGKSWNPQISVPEKVSIPRLAEGGMPDVGSLYYAGEAGSELVANMKGGTGVMNIEQFETAMVNANTEVVNAIYAMANMVVGAVNNKDLDVYLNAQKIGQSVTQYQNNYARQYGG